jgi:hypothetical protein
MAKVTRKQIEELQKWAIGAGIMRDPNSYTADELKYFNPEIPGDFIDDYVDVRDGRKHQSDWDRVPLKIEDL